MLGENKNVYSENKGEQMEPIKPATRAPYEGEDPYPSLSDFHDYEPQLEFDDAELMDRKEEEEFEEEYEENGIPLAASVSSGKDYLESPMSDGTIEEDFEEALAKEVAAAGELGSPDTPMVNSKVFEGMYKLCV